MQLIINVHVSANEDVSQCWLLIHHNLARSFQVSMHGAMLTGNLPYVVNTAAHQTECRTWLLF